jgi:hypothetical protein
VSRWTKSRRALYPLPVLKKPLLSPHSRGPILIDSSKLAIPDQLSQTPVQVLEQGLVFLANAYSVFDLSNGSPANFNLGSDLL